MSGAGNSWTGSPPPTVKTWEVRVGGKVVARIAKKCSGDAADDFFRAEAALGRYPASCRVGGLTFRNHRAGARP